MSTTFQTLLVMAETGVPLWSARGLTQTLELIPAARNLRRTVNGVLIDLSYSQFSKYQSEISCSDVRAPAIDSWPDVVTVACVAELCVIGSNTPQRDAVSGSERTEGDFTFYRPILLMRVQSFSQSFREWAAENTWRLGLVEA